MGAGGGGGGEWREIGGWESVKELGRKRRVKGGRGVGESERLRD